MLGDVLAQVKLQQSASLSLTVVFCCIGTHDASQHLHQLGRRNAGFKKSLECQLHMYALTQSCSQNIQKTDCTCTFLGADSQSTTFMVVRRVHDAEARKNRSLAAVKR